MLLATKTCVVLPATQARNSLLAVSRSYFPSHRRRCLCNERPEMGSNPLQLAGYLAFVAILASTTLVEGRNPQRLQSSRCVDTFPACPGWVGQCAVPGVAQDCPCMCATGGTGGPPAGQCTAQPAAQANANPFSCSLPANPGASCTTACLSGYTGTPSASCSNSVWSVAGACTQNTTGGCTDTFPACPGWVGQCQVPGVATDCPCMCGGGGGGGGGGGATQCTSQPQPVSNGSPFNCPTNNSGATCTAGCATGYTGSQTATCGSSGTWSVTGSCSPSSGGGGGGGGGSVTDYITPAQWDQFFPNRNNAGCQGAASDFYNYNAFVTAAGAFPGFGTSSPDPTVNKRELAAFLGQMSHETTGGWASAPGGPYAWGLCFVTEGGNTPPAADYCAATAQYPCAPGKKYFGRGPLQLSWNYNYIPAGQAIGFDGLNNPEIVATDPVISFKTAIWFWMTPQAPKPSCHDVITGQYTSTSPDKPVGYGMLTNIINGGTECGKGSSTPQETDRIGFYQRYTDILGISPGDNLSCANQSPF